MSYIPSTTQYALPTPGDLPTNSATWVTDPARTVLLVHDMQRYFLRSFTKDFQDQLVRNVASLRDRCRAAGVPVAYTAQPGDMTEEQRGLLRDFWGPGMRATPPDREIVEPLRPDPDDTVFTKWRYSAFHRSDLLQWIRDQKRDQVVVCGVYGHVGILATAVEAFSNDLQTFLAADAIGDFSEQHHRLTLEYAAQRCAMVVGHREVLA